MDFFEKQIMWNNEEEVDSYDDWRIYAVEGNEYDINPYDYESRDEYLQAIIDFLINMEICVDEFEDEETDDEWLY